MRFAAFSLLTIVFLVTITLDSLVFAQPTTGSIEGVIRIEGGEALPNIRVALLNQQTAAVLAT